MTTGKLPFEGHIHQIFDSIRSDAYQIPIPDWADKNLRELLTNMLHRDPVRRWSLKQVRECDWFRKKHSFIREDLTSLPKEIIQKEHATFSMSPNLIMLYQKRADQLTIDLNNYLKISLENVPDHHGTAPNTQPPFHSANIKELSQATKKERSKKSCALM
jgi:serine/threonine protein kinase